MDPNTASSTHDISSPAAGAMFYWIALLSVPQSAEPFLPGSWKKNATSIESPLYVPLYLSVFQHIHYGHNQKHTRAPGCFMATKRLCSATIFIAILFSLKTMKSLQIGVATHFQGTPLFSTRTVLLVSLQSCRSVDANAWCKRVTKYKPTETIETISIPKI